MNNEEGVSVLFLELSKVEKKRSLVLLLVLKLYKKKTKKLETAVCSSATRLDGVF